MNNYLTIKTRFIYCLLCIITCSCNQANNKEQEGRPSDQVRILKDSLPGSAFEKPDSFYINHILFVHKKMPGISTAVFQKESGNKKTTIQQSANKTDTLADESCFLYDMFYLYHYSPGLLNLSVELVDTLAKHLGWSDENLLMYRLKAEENKVAVLAGYGKCRFFILKKKEPANGEQSKFMVLLNKQRREISLWDFDNFILKDGNLFVDVRMKGMHSLYRVGFYEKADRFYFTGDE